LEIDSSASRPTYPIPQLPGALPQRPHICGIAATDLPDPADFGGAVTLITRCVLVDPQSGQSILTDCAADRINFSNFDLHASQVYS
jgi:hypothetical protein